MADCYPCVHRIAHGLSGRDDIGRHIVRHIMRRGLKLLPNWKEEADPARWCQHHTVLTARRTKRKPDVASDTLVRSAKTDNAYYAAFVRALRALPVQQKEAFILHHGEQLDTRGLAVAMDCSTEAAANHLREATRSLTALGGDYFATFTAQLAQTYQSLTPVEELVLTNVTFDARRHFWPRRVWWIVRALLTVVTIALIVLFVWKIWPLLVY
jgi:DNA-directed RNA polymerase specialized sigma24 family protein